MKQFDPNKPYCRRDGKPAKIVYETDKIYCVLSTYKSGAEYCYSIHKSGFVYAAGESWSDCDLVNVPEEIEGYMNIYKIDGNYVGGNINKQKDVSDLSTAVACIKVSFTEGEGLDD